uniref:Secreted protein n=1 Tax=Rousettus aegyptiacus TaxID=9407 RepID=A0A7J8B8B9_ROUAE|nr:hypothetical protein HJG63_010031 [Rousettus aegyptiacus]
MSVIAAFSRLSLLSAHACRGYVPTAIVAACTRLSLLSSHGWHCCVRMPVIAAFPRRHCRVHTSVTAVFPRCFVRPSLLRAHVCHGLRARASLLYAQGCRRCVCAHHCFPHTPVIVMCACLSFLPVDICHRRLCACIIAFSQGKHLSVSQRHFDSYKPSKKRRVGNGTCDT